MKLLHILFSVAVCQGSILDRSMRNVGSIARPDLVSLSAIDPTGFKIDWTQVLSDISNPILGYKLKVWEQPRRKSYKYEVINGAKVLVEEYIRAKFPLTVQEPSFEPRMVLVRTPDETSAQGTHLKPGVIYEFRVQAYTKYEDGPLSAPMRIEFEHTPPVKGTKVGNILT